MITEYDTWGAVARWQEKYKPSLPYVLAISEFVKFVEDSEILSIDYMSPLNGPLKRMSVWTIDLVRAGCLSSYPLISLDISMDGYMLSAYITGGAASAHQATIPTQDQEQFRARLRHLQQVIKEKLDFIAKDSKVSEATENYLDDENLPNPRR